MAASLGISGGDKMAWVYYATSVQEGDTTDRPPTWRFAFCRSEVKTGLRWYPIPDEFAGKLNSAAVLNQRLHAFWSDGTHRIYSMVRGESGLNLPGAALPLALAPDESADVLYAVVQAEVGRKIKPVGQTDETTPAETAKRKPDTPAEEEQPPAPEADPWADATLVTLKYDRGRWHRDRIMPDWLAPERPFWIVGWKGTLTLVFKRPDDGAGYRLSSRGQNSDDWTDPVDLPEADSRDLRDVVLVGGDLVLLTAAASAPNSITAIRRSNGRWQVGQPFDRQELSHPKKTAFFAPSGDRIIGVWVDEMDRVESAAWSVAGGPPEINETIVLPIRDTAPRGQRDWKRQLVAYALLGSVLAILFVRRRNGVVQTVVLPPGDQPVRHSRRLVAFAIDAALVGPCVFYLFVYPLVGSLDPNVPLQLQLAPDDQTAGELLWRVTAMPVTFILYATLFELWWGATPGKRILHCHVLSEDGRPCTRQQIIVRNALRMIEFFPTGDLGPTLILIVLTRNRQRLGDLVARTIVVERVPEESESPTRSDPPAM
jgi:uncharacterized RDD family membrane protein YckC